MTFIKKWCVYKKEKGELFFMKRIYSILLIMFLVFSFCTQVYAMDNLYLCDEEMLSINLETGERIISNISNRTPLNVIWNERTNSFVTESNGVFFNNSFENSNKTRSFTSDYRNTSTSSFPKNVCGFICNDNCDELTGEIIEPLSYGSGIIISHNAVLTSAHVVWNMNDDRPYHNITFEPGKTIGTSTNEFSPISINLPTLFTHYHNDEYDFALLIFDDYSFSNWAGIAYCSDYTTHNNEEVSIIGYPSNDHPYQHTYTGEITDSNQYYYYYDMETSNGVSGAPILEQNTNYVIGIHKGSNPSTFYDGDKRCIRISQNIFTIIVNWAS